MGFNLGNAIKYVWRAGLKSADHEKDLRKALWYIEREIARRRKLYGQDNKPEKHRAVDQTAGH